MSSIKRNYPDGSTYSFAQSLGVSIPITNLTNAENSIATALGHNLTMGDEVLITCGWNSINGGIYKVISVSADEFTLGSTNTQNADVNPAGGGIGFVQKIESWMRIQPVDSFSSSGGEPEINKVDNIDSDTAEDDFLRYAPVTYEMVLDDNLSDVSQVGYTSQKMLTEKAKSFEQLAFKMTTKKGAEYLFYAQVSMSPVPKMDKGKQMQLTAKLNARGPWIRYPAGYMQSIV